MQQKTMGWNQTRVASIRTEPKTYNVMTFKAPVLSHNFIISTSAKKMILELFLIFHIIIYFQVNTGFSKIKK